MTQGQTEAAIRGLVDAFVEGWNAGDGAAASTLSDTACSICTMMVDPRPRPLTKRAGNFATALSRRDYRLTIVATPASAATLSICTLGLKSKTCKTCMSADETIIHEEKRTMPSSPMNKYEKSVGLPQRNGRMPRSKNL